MLRKRWKRFSTTFDTSRDNDNNTIIRKLNILTAVNLKWRLFASCDTAGQPVISGSSSFPSSLVANTTMTFWYFSVERKMKEICKGTVTTNDDDVAVGCCLSRSYATMKTNCRHFCSKKNVALRMNNQRAISITNFYELAQLSSSPFSLSFPCWSSLEGRKCIFLIQHNSAPLYPSHHDLKRKMLCGSLWLLWNFIFLLSLPSYSSLSIFPFRLGSSWVFQRCPVWVI